MGYEAGYLSVTLMIQNIYTTQFATRVELNSAITQTVSSIDLSVNQKLTAYSTTTEMNSAINLKANEINSTVSTKVGKEEIISRINQTSEQITIDASKINLNGVVTANNYFKINLDGSMETISGKIAGWTITNDSLDSETAGMSNGHYYAFYVKNGNTTPYYVTLSGDLSCNSLLINGSPTMKTSTETGKQIINYYVDGNQLITSTINSLYVVLPDSIISDKNMKKEIKPTLINGIDIIKQMDFVQFDWKGNKEHEDIGVIVQDVEKINPYLVTDVDLPDGTNSKVFNSSRMILVNSKAIQELYEEIEKLKERIK